MYGFGLPNPGCRPPRPIIKITDDIGLDEREVKERFVRAPGPGGQNVDKVTTNGVPLIGSREDREQGQNREAAPAQPS